MAIIIDLSLSLLFSPLLSLSRSKHSHDEHAELALLLLDLAQDREQAHRGRQEAGEKGRVIESKKKILIVAP